MQNSPHTIDVYAIVCDESSVGNLSAVSLRPQVLDRTIDRRQERGFGLNTVLVSVFCVGDSPQVQRVVLSRPIERIFQGQRDGWGRLARPWRLHELNLGFAGGSWSIGLRGGL